MDDPALDAARRAQALRGLARANRWSRSTQIIWSALRGLLPDARGEVLRVLDIATGAGDVPIGLAQRARRADVRLQVDGCDISPVALEYARQHAAQVEVAVRFFALDALRDALPANYDVLISSLFLHHLSDGEAERLLARLGQAARRLVVINDLQRTPVGLLMAYLGTRLLTRSDVVHTDGERSVRAAFTLDEARTLAARAGLHNAVIARRWPRRFVLIWRR
jgi:SAM-dependent methyltransferase